jgi:hypothetical protein
MRIDAPPRPKPVPPRPLPREGGTSATAPVWKPQEVGLTRQELRAIVIGLIG